MNGLFRRGEEWKDLVEQTDTERLKQMSRRPRHPHLAAHSRGLRRGDVVITGSIITSKNMKPGDLVKYSIEGLGEVELRVD